MFHISFFLKQKQNQTTTEQNKQTNKNPTKIFGKHSFITENINFRSALGLYIFLAG